MAHGIWPAVGRLLLLHPGWAFVLGFLLPIALAYWSFALAPYCRGWSERLLSPWHVRRPSVPGVLERYAAWEWINDQMEDRPVEDRPRSEVETK